MTAKIINIKDHLTRTSEQTVNAFYALYQSETVEKTLWEIFKTCAKAEKENQGPDSRITAIAHLFDHLIAFTKAIHQLRSGTHDKCSCGRSQASDSS